MKKFLGIVYLAVLALVTHVAVKSYFDVPAKANPYNYPPCLSNLTTHSATFNAPLGRVDFYAKVQCDSGYYSNCYGISTKWTAFIWDGTNWIVKKAVTSGTQNPFCGEIVDVWDITFPANYDGMTTDVCYVWQGWWHNLTGSVAFRDEIYVHL